MEGPLILAVCSERYDWDPYGTDKPSARSILVCGLLRTIGSAGAVDLN
ncbi:hypothetical protein J2W42_005270 [Rhizobium tibeticum]|nr:hypothetical protein [Rhizobium tibeticum]MDP9812400.1 hypothetical protein [Rhizobium tibeticum]